MTVEAGLGGHDNGVSGDDEGGQNNIAPDIKTESIGTVRVEHPQGFCGKSERL